MYALTWFGVALWFASWFAAGWYWRGRWERRRRRGGYVKLPASGHTRARGRATPATDISARISSYSLRGDQSAGAVTRARLRLVNRPGAPTLSGNATAEAGANGAPDHFAAFASQPLTFKPW